MTQKPTKRQLTIDDPVNGIRTLLHQDDEDDVIRDKKYGRDQKRSNGVDNAKGNNRRSGRR